MRVGKDGILEKLRKEEADRIEKGADIWRRLERGKNGETALSKDLIATFESLMMEGNTRTNAARVVGLARKTMAAWLRKGATDVEKGNLTLEAEFTWMVDRCEGEQERVLSRKAYRYAIADQADGTLALKILERRNVDDWAPALPEGQDVGAQFAGLATAALRQEARRVLSTAVKEEVGEVVQPASLPAKLELEQ